jgi:nucleoside-diphosphate-sugar epimerase
MASDLILLTGATGLIGFRILVFCLRKGYRVRVVLRTLAKEKQILSTPSIRGLATTTNLSFVEVSDFSLPTVFDDALQDVDYVIHVAAPIASADPSAIGPDLATHYLMQTTDAALNLLQSAQTHQTVKRIILTHSLAAIFDHVTDTETTVHTELTRATHIQKAPYNSPFEAYTAAKVSALKLTEQWIESVKPAFDLVHIAPGHVFGPNELVTDPEDLLKAGTNRIILVPVTGKAYGTEAGVTVHLDDVAEAHVRALDPATPGNRLYILSSGGLEGTKLDECFEIVARNFPDHIDSTLPNNGSLPSFSFKVDASDSARVLGIHFMPFERQVCDTVEYYLECVKKRGSMMN